MSRVLVVDDCKQWRETLRAMLEASLGYQVVAEARDGLEAVQKAATLRPEVVLIDIGMPILNGIGAAPRIRRASPHSKVIFVTQENDPDLKNAALATGAEGYCLKSNVVSELIPAIDALVAQQASSVLTMVTMPAHSLAAEYEAEYEQQRS